MATVTEAITLYKQVRVNGITRYQFRYTFDNGEVHQRQAWVSSALDESTVRAERQAMMIEELAEAEFNRLVEV